MVVDKIKPEPNDDRVKRVTTEVNGQRWCKLKTSQVLDMSRYILTFQSSIPRRWARRTTERNRIPHPWFPGHLASMAISDPNAH